MRPFPDKRDAVALLREITEADEALKDWYGQPLSKRHREARARLRTAIQAARGWLRQRGYSRDSDRGVEGASRIRGNRADFIIFDDPAAAHGSGVGDEWFRTLKPL